MLVHCDICDGHQLVEKLTRSGFSASYCLNHVPSFLACDMCGEEAETLFDFHGDELCHSCADGTGESVSEMPVITLAMRRAA